MACPSVTLNGLVIDEETEDANGTVWHLDSLQGWWDSTPIRLASQEQSPRGEIVTVAHELGRALVLEATATLPDTTQALGDLCWYATETAKAAGRAVYASVLMTVVDPTNTLHAQVRRAAGASGIKTAILGQLNAVQVQWQLFMPDPMRYDVDNNPFD